MTVVAALGPQGAALAQAPLTTPLTFSAATPADGLADLPNDPWVTRVAWWRLDVPAGPDQLLWVDATHSEMPGGAQAVVLPYYADTVLTQAPSDLSGLHRLSSVLAETLTLRGGRTYIFGVGAYTGQADGGVTGAVYRLMLSDYGEQAVEQLPDVTAVWAYTQTQEQPTPDPDNYYNLNQALVAADYGPAFGADMLIIGTLFDSDPGSMTQENADRNTGHRGVPTAPAQVEAHGIATAYLPYMTYGHEISLHLWQMAPPDADGSRPNKPTPPLTTLRTDSQDRTWVGYYAQTVDGEDGPGRYEYLEQASSSHANLSSFLDWVGPSAHTPDSDVYNIIWPKYGSNDYAFDGDATFVSAWMKPDVVRGGVNPVPRPGQPVWPQIATVWVDWSQEWRTPHVTQSDPVNGDPLNPPQKWGPNQQVQVWTSAGGGAWHLDTPATVPDILDQNMQGRHWLGSGKVLPGMQDKPAMATDDWTPIANPSDLVAWERANAGQLLSSVCAVVMPVPMHQGTSPTDYGLREFGDSPWESMVATWQSKLVFKTTIRPAPLRVRIAPVVPDAPVETIPVIAPLLTAELKEIGQRFE